MPETIDLLKMLQSEDAIWSEHSFTSPAGISLSPVAFDLLHLVNKEHTSEWLVVISSKVLFDLVM